MSNHATIVGTQHISGNSSEWEFHTEIGDTPYNPTNRSEVVFVRTLVDMTGTLTEIPQQEAAQIVLSKEAQRSLHLCRCQANMDLVYPFSREAALEKAFFATAQTDSMSELELQSATLAFIDAHAQNDDFANLPKLEQLHTQWRKQAHFS